MPKSDPPNGGLLLAVSGGIDSMLLAHILATSLSPVDRSSLYIAHFNHGLRADSNQDEQLVADFAAAHGVTFVSARANLPDRSEDTARKARHDFLERKSNEAWPSGSALPPAKQPGEACPTSKENRRLPRVATAHHLDDLVESIAINLSRGTGWRGLAVLNRANYIRPLLTLEKTEIQSLARECGVKWHEDSTNLSQKYLRNRLRPKTAALPFDTKWKLLKLRNRQVEIQREIEALLATPCPNGPACRRASYHDLDPKVALELLRYTLLRQNIRSTHPELRRLLHAVRAYEPGKKFQLTDNRFVVIRKDDFILS